MRKILTSLICVSLLISCSKEGNDVLYNDVTSEEINTHNAIGDPPGKGDRLIKFGTYSKPCDCNGDGSTDGCDGDRGICLIIRFGIDDKVRPLGDRIGVGEFTFNGLGNDIVLSMKEDGTPPNQNVDKFFHVNEDLHISADIIPGGYVIKQGIYEIDYSNNPLGDVVFSTNN